MAKPHVLHIQYNAVELCYLHLNREVTRLGLPLLSDLTDFRKWMTDAEIIQLYVFISYNDNFNAGVPF